MDEHAINAIIDRVYEAGIDGSKWQTVVQELQGHFPYSTVILYGHDFTTKFVTGVVQKGLLPDFSDRYESDFAQINVMAKGFARVPLSAVVTADALCDRGELLKSQFYSDFLRPQGIGAGVGVVVLREPSRFMSLTMNCGFGRMDEQERAMGDVLQILAPHVRRSFALSRSVAAQRFAGPHFRAMLEAVPGAVFLLDYRGLPVQFNAAAEKLLTKKTAVGIHRGGQIYVMDRNADQAISRALDCIARRNYADLNDAVLFSTSEGLYAAALRPFVVETEYASTPLSVLIERRPVAILTLTNLSERMNGGVKMASLHYGLTPAEAKLAVALTEGMTLAQFSDHNAISIHTARNQLKSVFWKTGTARQSELVALFQRLQALSGVIPHQAL